MIGSGLKKLAAENGLQVDGGVAYGVLNGCFVSLSEGAGYKRMCIYVGSHHRPENEQPTQEGEIPEYLRAANAVAELIAEKAADFKAYRVMNSQHKLPGVAIRQGGCIVQVNFFDNPGTMKCIQAFAEEILPQVAPLTDIRVCAKCGAPSDSNSKPVLLSEEAVVPMHQACADVVVQAAAARGQVGAGKTAAGIIGAVIGALLGAGVWTLVGMTGYIASIVGLVIAFLAGKGYDLLGGKPGKVKLFTVIVCVVLAVVVGTIGTEIYYLHDYYQEAIAEIELEAWEEIVPESEFMMETIPMLWEDAEARAALAKDIFMGLFFAGLGCLRLIKETSGTNKGGKIRILKA